MDEQQDSKDALTTTSTYPQLITEYDWNDPELEALAYRVIDLIRVTQGSYKRQ